MAWPFAARAQQPDRIRRIGVLMTALGRQEIWEDSPEGYPQSRPYKWWNWHDSYVPNSPPGSEMGRSIRCRRSEFPKAEYRSEEMTGGRRSSRVKL